MYNTNDEVLTSSLPPSLSEDTFRQDIAEIMDNTNYHSDEVSETDIEKTQVELRDHIRPKNKNESDDHHVIRVYDKPWRSRRVRKMILIF